MKQTKKPRHYAAPRAAKPFGLAKARPGRYQDFVIGTPSWLLYLVRALTWVMYHFFGKSPKVSYYGTTVRRVGKSKIEVTFDLPPTIKQQMSKAIESGKAIRLFVL